MINRVRAIIMVNNNLLTIKRIKKDIIYFVFPGGRVEKGENLEEAIKRECKEELGVEIEIMNNFASARFDRGDIKQQEHFFICKIISGELGTGIGPEYNIYSVYEGTHKIEWLCMDKLQDYDLRPQNITLKLLDYLRK